MDIYRGPYTLAFDIKGFSLNWISAEKSYDLGCNVERLTSGNLYFLM